LFKESCIGKSISKGGLKCMKLTNETIQRENSELLMEILALRTKLGNLYNEKGPINAEYISESLKLDLLIDEYFNAKMEYLARPMKDELIEI
jgi:hypothetical protein